MIRVLVVDDHAVVREGLKRILADAGDIAVVGEAVSEEQALREAGKRNCDVVVTDITLPGRGGLELLKDLKRDHPRVPVLVLSVHAEEQFALRALKAGAAGYLTKETAPEELVLAIRKAARGGRYMSAAVAEQLANRLSADAEVPPHQLLSDREFQVLTMIAQGKTLRAAADELSLSIKTVATYRTRLLEKLELNNTAEMIAYAIRNRLAD